MTKEACTFKDKTFYFDPDVYLPDFQRSMFFEEDVDRTAWWDIKPNNVIIDVGAGTGSWALPAAIAGAKTIAFECDPWRVNALKANVACNPGMDMIIDDRGLYSKECELDMDMSSSSVMLRLGYQPSQRVKMTTLDQWWKNNGEPGFGLDLDYIKIDVEGCEAHVLAGAVETIKKYKPKIIVEAHTFIVPGIDGIVLSFINRLGLYYKCTSVLRKSKPGPVDLRDYTFPRLFFEIE